MQRESKDDMIEVRQALKNDAKGIIDMYNEFLDSNGVNNPPRWTKGVYPSESFVNDTISNGTMHVAVCEGEIVSAMVLNHEFTSGYETVNWDIDVPDNEVISLHTLCVNINYKRRGIATEMMRYAVSFARENGFKAVRLDVIDGNDGANKFYKSAGFVCKGEHKLVYESTDCTKFTMYEYIV